MPSGRAAPISNARQFGSGNFSAYATQPVALRFPKISAAAELWFVICGLAIFMGALINLLIGGGDEHPAMPLAELWTDDKREAVRAFYMPIYMLSSLLVL